MGSEATAKAATITTHAPDRADVNLALVSGSLASEPEARSLPSGSVAMSFSLTVRKPGHKTTSVPIVWYDPPKRVNQWKPGDVVVVSGQVVRRFFRGSGGLGSATEVVVVSAQLARHTAKVDRLLAGAAQAVSERAASSH